MIVIEDAPTAAAAAIAAATATLTHASAAAATLAVATPALRLQTASATAQRALDLLSLALLATDEAADILADAARRAHECLARAGLAADPLA